MRLSVSNPSLAVPAVSSLPLPVSVMLRYGVGMVGAQIFRDAPAALLPVFMTTVLGVPAWLAGFAILLPKVWVIFCDPLTGAWSDRRAPTLGRTPFLATGAIATSLGFLALFHVPALASPLASAALVSLVFLLAMTGFSAFSVPYLAIAASLSTDPYERTKLLVFRLIFTSVAIIAGVGFAQPAVFWFGGGAQGWRAMSWLYAAICVASMLGCTLGLRPVLKARPAPAADTSSLAQRFAAAWRNQPFRQLTVIHFLQTIAQACAYTVVAMVFIYLVDRIALLPVTMMAMSICGIVAQPLWLVVSKRIGKIPLFTALCIGWCAVTATWLGIDWGAGHKAMLPVLGETSLKEALIVLRGALLGVTNAGFILLVTSLFTDTVYLGGEQGGAVEGSYAGLWSASEKLAFAIGPVIAGAVLSLSGFVPSRAGPGVQSHSALFGILANYSIIPIGFFVVSLCLVPRYARSVREAEARLSR
jgi:GPH family glycoside/pentoside/hexuronide:cation symporter